MPRENPTSTPTGILTFLGGLALLAIFAVIVVYWFVPMVPLTTSPPNGQKGAKPKRSS